MLKRFVNFFIIVLISHVSVWSLAKEIKEDASLGNLIEIFAGKKIRTQNHKWGVVHLDFRKDGRVFGSNNGGTDSGKWRVEGNSLCLSWDRWDYNGCGEVSQKGDIFEHLYPNGQPHFWFRLNN